jgi:hypothetical protein
MEVSVSCRYRAIDQGFGVGLGYSGERNVIGEATGEAPGR